MSRRIDKFFKGKLGDQVAAYQDKDWQVFEAMLDDRKKPGSVLWSWIVFLFIVVSFLFFIPQSFFNSPFFSNSTSSSVSISPDTSNKEIVNLGPERRYKIEKETKLSNKTRPTFRSNFNSLASLDAAFQENLETGFNGYDFGLGSVVEKNKQRSFNLAFSSDPINYKERMINMYPIDHMSGITEQGAGLLPVSPLAKLSSPPEGLYSNQITPVVQARTSRFSYGLGLMVGNENLSDIGVLFEINYAINSRLGLAFRPNIFYSSSQGSSQTFTQEYYDFGRNELEIELQSTDRFQLDLPVFLTIQSQRHQLGLGGGLALVTGERYKENRKIISDKDRVREGMVQEIYESDTYWSRADSEPQPFVEAYYQYFIHPKWRLGLRSRWAFNDDQMESNASTRTIHYGVTLTYSIK